VPVEVRAEEELRRGLTVPGLGRAALVLALGLVPTLLVGGYAALTGRRRLADSAQNAFVAAFAAARGVRRSPRRFPPDDLSFAYVADHSSRDLPARYAFTAFWSGQEGSLLLRLLVLTGMGAAACC
jgi:cytochrome c-type biogenesis protein CcmF